LTKQPNRFWILDFHGLALRAGDFGLGKERKALTELSGNPKSKI
jgi:hypothetical protein